jgi:putative Mn2+ efflux pump MntP
MGAALDRARRLKVAASFGFFQFGMLLVGFLAGSTIVGVIESFDHWLGFILLVFIGARMLKESFEKESETGRVVDISQGKALVALSVATSIDSLAVGLTFAFVQVAIIPAAVLVGLVSFGVSLLGFAVGRRLGEMIGKRAELFGGLVLIGIGIKILVEGLSS